MSVQLSVDVHIELVCPWCLIGKRHLARALDQFRQQHPDASMQVRWLPFQLLPQIPVGGLPYQRFYEQRLGGPLAVAARRQQVQQAAAAVGLRLNFDAIALMPNTRRVHGLMTSAAAQADGQKLDQLVDALFSAYFLEGKDIGDPKVLVSLATGVGLDADEALASLDQQAETPSGAGAFVSGVPYFVFNGRIAVSGAQPASVLLDAMNQSV